MTCPQIAGFYLSTEEGAAVSVVGFIVAVKKQYGGSGESTNCHFNKADFVDAHVALVESAGQGEEKALVVEPTPRFYATHPTWKWRRSTISITHLTP